MEIPVPKRRLRKLNRSGIDEKQSELYEHVLQMYKVPPTDEITLNEFNEFAFERMKVLRIVEQTMSKYREKVEEARQHFLMELHKNKLMMYCRRETSEELTDAVYEERRRDHISHFILRLAHCKTETLRRWFLQQECDLFKFRFLGQGGRVSGFLEANGLDYETISSEEKVELLNKLMNSGHRLTEDHILKYNLYKVHFTEILELVQYRKAYLVRGYAYVPERDFVSVIVNVFRTHLSHTLAVTARRLPQLEDDTRLLEMIKGLHNVYLGKNYSIVTNSGEISKDCVDEMSKKSFPLCMRILHESLRQNHHLRHGGRLQYGLFLKGIGISLDDAITFFREEFTRVMDIDKFEKQYVYNIRYNYGKEGKRANYTPYSCKKIITSNPPGPGDSHGCPFRHADKENLKLKLKSLHLSPSGINEIMDLNTKGHYQVACKRYFELTHKGVTMDQGIDHPNQYFTESTKVLGGGEPASRSSQTVTTTRSQVFQTQTEENVEEMDEEIDDGALLLALQGY